MSEPTIDQAVIVRLRSGDEQAAAQVVDCYIEKMVRLARKRIHQRLAGRVEPEDIVQSVFRTFFHRAKQGQFTIEDQEDVCKLLARITLRKTFRQVHRHLAAKRCATREVIADDDSQKFLLTLVARDPAPEEAASLIEEMEKLLAQLRPADRTILEMRLQGYTSLEISEKLGVSDRKVRRLMERVRSLAAQDFWEGEPGEATEPPPAPEA